MKTMNVKAPPGLKCPMEGKPRKYITDDEKGVDVPVTAYYRRLIVDGSLLDINAEAEKAKAVADKKSAQGGEK